MNNLNICFLISKSMELFFKIELKAESGRDREPGDGIIKHQV
jgi:hypothetical protein